jgi:hypothetical protein
MAFQEKIDQLVTKLTDLTETGKVAWDETADENVFVASVGKFVVSLGQDEDSWGNPIDRFRFRVLDGTGKTIDEALSYQGALSSQRDAEERDRLQRLHGLARRSALHTEEVLTDLLSSLERI